MTGAALQPPHRRLRAWGPEDERVHTIILNDRQVARWLGGPFPSDVARQIFQNMSRGLVERGWGMWAVLDDDGRVVGAAGVQPTPERLALSPAIEAAWRLAPDAWGRGYITEVMRPILSDAHSRIPCEEVVSFTAAGNLRSQAVMQRLGFQRDPSRDFHHPALPPDHELGPHVVYALRTRGA
ncbi:GNAT family N-acetyltransferase [bacterium]|nr:GNAT family N-acetyltransferase [bacterium]